MRRDRCFALFAMLLLLGAVFPSAARAGWAPQAERRAVMAGLAQKHRFALVTPQTARAFNRRFETTLPRSNVAIVRWDQFPAFVKDAQSHLLGAGWVNHGDGPHGILVVGDRARDSIEETFDRSYREGGKTRDRWLGGTFREGGLVFALWHAPTEDLTRVGQRSEEWLNRDRECGHHCVHMVHEPLTHSSFFATLPTLEYPPQGAEALLRLDPDLVVQVVSEASHRLILSNPTHHIDVWSRQGTEPPQQIDIGIPVISARPGRP